MLLRLEPAVMRFAGAACADDLIVCNRWRSERLAGGVLTLDGENSAVGNGALSIDFTSWVDGSCG